MAREVTPEQIEMLDAMVARAHGRGGQSPPMTRPVWDCLCQAVAAAVVDMKVGQLADEAVDETGLGDKVPSATSATSWKLISSDCLR